MLTKAKIVKSMRFLFIGQFLLIIGVISQLNIFFSPFIYSSLFTLVGTFLFAGSVISTAKGISVRAETGLTETSFIKVNANHNNVYLANEHAYEGMLQFDVGFASESKPSVNLATSSYELGSKMKYNGVAIKDIPNFFACYYVGGTGGKMLWFKVPEANINPSNGYKYSTVEIPKGTQIYDTVTKEDVKAELRDGIWSTSFGSDVCYSTTKVSGITAYEMTGGYSLISAEEAGYTEGNGRALEIFESTTAMGITVDFTDRNIPTDHINSITFKVKFNFSAPITTSEFRVTNDGGTSWLFRYDISNAVNDTWYTFTYKSDKTAETDIPNGQFVENSYRALSTLGTQLTKFNPCVRIKGANMGMTFGDITVDYDTVTTASFIGVNKYNNNNYTDGKYATMLEFDNKFASESRPSINLALADYDLGNKMLFNGVAIKDIPGFAAQYYYALDVSTPMIVFYVPEAYNVPAEGNEYATLFIPAGTEVFDLTIKEDVSLRLKNGKWVGQIKENNFKAVNTYNNNNFSAAENMYSTMLEFENKFAENDNTSINLATSDHDLGNKMTLNGVLVKDIPGFFAAYYYAVDAQTAMLWFKVPAAYITPSNGYKHTTLFIPKSTEIYDTFVGKDVEIYISNDKWMVSDGKWSPNPEELDEFDYSFAVVPDTQDINYNAANDYHKIYDWIVDNKDSKKIAHTIGLGDITEKNAKAEWDRARASFDQLEEAGMSHSQVRGNHDMSKEFDEFFKNDEYYNKGIVETFENMSNFYRELRIGGSDYLILGLDYGPSNNALDWANEVVENHPFHNVIVVTHGYLFRDGTTLDEHDELTPSTSTTDNINNGEEIWQKFVKKHENITMVLSGHIYCDNIIVTTATGEHGNKVTQVLIDPQQIDRSGTKTGMVAMFYFSNGGKNVQIEYYSTLLEMYETTSATKKFTVPNQAAHEHVYVEHAATSSTCAEAGNVKYFTCSNEQCNKVFVENGQGQKVESTMEDILLPLADHEIKPGTVEFEFEEDGSSVEVTYECSVCHNTITVPTEEVTLTNKQTKDPTCTEKGETTYTATWGDYSDTLVLSNIKANGHSLTKVNGEASTCTQHGYKDYYECTVCHAKFEDSKGTKPIENLDSWKVGVGQLALASHKTIYVEGKPSTCVEHGYKGYYECSVCHGLFEDAAGKKPIADLDSWKSGAGQLELAAHTLVKQDGQASSCTEHGWKDYYKCSECDALFEDAGGTTPIADLEVWKVGAGQLPLDPNNHEHMTKHTATIPTCEEAGNYKYFTCDECGEVFMEIEGVLIKVTMEDTVISANGHAYTLVPEIAATEEADGVKEHYTCDECGKIFTKKGDEYVEVTVDELIIKYVAPTSKPEPEPEKKGCGSSIVAASAIVTTLTIAGIALVAGKKKED